MSELESDAAEGEGGHTEQKSRTSKWQLKYKELQNICQDIEIKIKFEETIVNEAHF